MLFLLYQCKKELGLHIKALRIIKNIQHGSKESLAIPGRLIYNDKLEGACKMVCNCTTPQRIQITNREK